MKTVPHLLTLLDPTGKPFYVYHRKIPKDLQATVGRDDLKISLGSSLEEAKVRISHLSQQHNSLFHLLRDPKKVGHAEAKALLIAHHVQFDDVLPGNDSKSV
ncbi:DUF6538 domain-containing protein [Polynucleobacter kasalickyi]|uniref:DUF6538 domain-containing protein n=1 Tax=Polynucleobacter kasalickyi TaxID=1938817 RepID=A0A1W1Y5Z6_9BURK|nr:DUF6538 domain-containing protein [Polynucleobacter kasalickyi]SMC31586.1 hypothetical protein SAMN06296008_10210 [Polynucleobacter kasalickyi]